MSSVRRKPAKALLCLVLALSVAAVFLLSSSAVFAEAASDNNSPIDSHLEVSGITERIDGHVNLSIAMEEQTISLQKNTNDNNYTGKIEVNIESSDLYHDAYQLYKKKYEKKRVGLKYYRNLVMFNKDKKFPTIDYKLTLPDGVTVATKDVQCDVSTTKTISKVELPAAEQTSNQVSLHFYLGNWDDYAGFFKKVGEEQNQKGHVIHIVIPFTATAGAVESNESIIKGNGSCSLWKYGSVINDIQLVNITSSNTWTLSAEATN